MLHTPSSTGRVRWALLVALLSFLPPVARGQDVTYERDVRPLLKTHCFHCHGEGEELAGGLDLRLRRLIAAGGESGAAIAPGNPADSVLYARMRDGEMPPEEAAIRPTEEDLDLIRRWIAQGAAAVHPEPESLDPADYITEQERSHWSFQPIGRPTPPATGGEARTPVDQFLLARLAAAGLGMSPQADRRTLVRRVYFDLLGLPPTPEEQRRFVEDPAPDAYERLLDRVLHSPRYGERWGRHWLDVAGYADSEGYTEDDPQRPDAYKYRDYVIRAFNQDKPLDRFLIEQLAGDELIGRSLENLTAEESELLVATGFLRMAPDGTAAGGVDATTARNEVLAKTVEIVSTSLLGLTVGCAQCHNHRYDPISHEDYYAFRAIFDPALNTRKWLTPKQRRVSLYTDADRAAAGEVEAESKRILAVRDQKQQEYIEAVFQRELAKLDEALREPIAEARRTPAKMRTEEQAELLRRHPSVNVTAGSLYLYDKQAADDLKRLADEAAAVLARKPVEHFVRAVWESAGEDPPPSTVFHRGDPEQPRQQVSPRELTILSASQAPSLPVNDQSLPSTGRRLAYARWLTSGEHPLAARVLVNRVWLNHFGRGLVPTPGDFGALGEPPTHPELLDWLARELMDHGWSLKHLHRVIMTSAAYRQSSRRSSELEARDPENALYGRMNVRRLEAEALRDAALSVSGELLLRAFGPAVPVMADRVGQFVIGKENLNAGRPGEVLPMEGEDLRRSVYVEVRRSRPLSLLAPFDLPRMEPNCTVRKSSTVSPQSLVLMNSPFVLDRARRMAERLLQSPGPDAARIDRAYRLACGVAPGQDETAEAAKFLEEQRRYFADHPAPAAKNQPAPSPELEAWTSFCQALLSSNQFLYVD